MKRKLMDKVGPKIACDIVDVTFENGKYHSVLNPDDGLINDLLDTLRDRNRIILTANQIGHNKQALALKTGKGVVVMLNPKIILKSRSQGKYYKKIRLSYYSIDGTIHLSKLGDGYARVVQEGMELLGFKI